MIFMASKKESTLFNTIEALFKKDRPLEELETRDTYMVLRFLSMNARTFLVAWTANYFSWRLPSWAVLSLVYYYIPKTNRIPNLRYLGKERDQQYDEQLIQKVCSVFAYSRQEAFDAIRVMEMQSLNVKDLFGIQKGVRRRGKEDR